MAKFIAILLIAFTAIQFTTAKSSSYISLINHILSSAQSQGGVLEFKSKKEFRFEKSINNSDSVMLSDYSGLPLKALQLKIVVGNTGKLKLKSISRGSSVPASDFIFDYQIYKGEIRADGSSIDSVIVVLLGNGEHALYPQKSHHILSIEYDVVQIVDDNDSTSIILSEVLGATCTPVQDANIKIGNDRTIYLNKLIDVDETQITLQQNFPNPFNPSTKIKFSLKNDGMTTLKIYNSVGEVIATLLNDYKSAGEYVFDYDAGNLSSGVYFYQINSGSYTEIKKMILIK